MIKEITAITNEILPGLGLGLVRTSRNAINQQAYYETAIYNRNIKCHFYQILNSIDLIKKYYYYYYKYKFDLRILNCVLPDDVTKKILSYNEFKDTIIIDLPYMDYRDLIYSNKNYYNRYINKWYITVSNIIYLFEPEYHTEILYIASTHKENIKDYKTKDGYKYYLYSDYIYDLEFNEFFKLIVLKYLKTTKEYLYEIMKHFIYKLIS